MKLEKDLLISSCEEIETKNSRNVVTRLFAEKDLKLPKKLLKPKAVEKIKNSTLPNLTFRKLTDSERSSQAFAKRKGNDNQLSSRGNLHAQNPPSSGDRNSKEFKTFANDSMMTKQKNTINGTPSFFDKKHAANLLNGDQNAKPANGASQKSKIKPLNTLSKNL